MNPKMTSLKLHTDLFVDFTSGWPPISMTAAVAVAYPTTDRANPIWIFIHFYYILPVPTLKRNNYKATYIT